MVIYGWLLIVLCGLNIVVYMAMIDSEKSQEYTGRGAIVNFLVNAIYTIYCHNSQNSVERSLILCC